MGERCAECAELRLERDQAISVQEELAKQLLAEAQEHALTRVIAERLARQVLRNHRAVVLCKDDSGYVAEIETLPNVVAHGATEEEARANAKKLGLAVLLGGWEPACPICQSAPHKPSCPMLSSVNYS